MVINDKYPEQKITIGRHLPTRIKIRLRDLLKRYIDVFAWTSAHITGVPRVLMIGGETFNIEHRINVLNHAEPVKQKKRSLAPERNEAIHSQLEELTEAGILREVEYQTWVSKPMVVKKDNGKWKLRVDFTNINKACIREPHPLPAAEQKAEGLHKYRLKCFLDAYKGYHQIPIAENDEEKIAFFTRERVFCYKILPFSLKNAGATYQKLIDKVIGHQIGRNMEVNADDMVIKSDSEEEMMADIIENLERLRPINLKLNLKKCSFGVEEGIYLGHIITKQGIRADPSKVKVVSTLRPPKTVSEMQNLNKEIAAMSREAKNEEVKRKEPEQENAWKLFTDGASRSEGSGAAVIPIEISVETKRVQDFDLKENEKRRREDLDILEEMREMASIKEAHYKQKLEGYYNKNVKPSTFKSGTYVLRLNSASKAEYQGKMGPTWEGPYVIRKAYGDGTYKLETLSGEAVDRTWNGTNLRKFYV
nr:reverse transcriptase domain-containing protein [Tanacetum cinerariifolium]